MSAALNSTTDPGAMALTAADQWSTTDLLAILPLGVLAAAAVLVLLVIATRRHHMLSAALCALGIIAAGICLRVANSYVPTLATRLFVADGYTVFFLAFVLVAALAVTLLSYGYLNERGLDAPQDEYYVLLLLATLGAGVMVASNHFISFLLGLETLSVSLLGLIAYPRSLERPVEAGIKYLVLSGVSAAFLLFGIALIYNQLGTLTFVAPRELMGELVRPEPELLAGIALFLVGIGFKLSLVPFHLWAPDIYEGAPAPVTAFVAVVSKCAVFALLLRYSTLTGVFESGSLRAVVISVAVLSMIVGNLLALLQDNVKRILAYSSIAHLGYALVAFLVGGRLAIEASSAYLVAYAITTLGAFGVITVLSRPGAGRDADQLSEYRGLLWTRPAVALTFAAMLLSLAGIPLTVGFIAKFYALTSGVDAGLVVPVGALILGSIIGLFYYLRIIVTMSASLPAQAPAPERASTSWLGNAVLTVLVLLLIGWGVYPAPLVSLIRTTALSVANSAPSAPAVSRAGP
jgi:NADH-quinone oxidoreductase subunit N